MSEAVKATGMRGGGTKRSPERVTRTEKMWRLGTSSKLSGSQLEWTCDPELQFYWKSFRILSLLYKIWQVEYILYWNHKFIWGDVGMVSEARSSPGSVTIDPTWCVTTCWVSPVTSAWAWADEPRQVGRNAVLRRAISCSPEVRPGAFEGDFEWRTTTSPRFFPSLVVLEFRWERTILPRPSCVLSFPTWPYCEEH